MASPTDKSPRTGVNTCWTCEGPMRGHTWQQGPVGNRKLICPPPEKVNEILRQLWDEGHQEFVREIIRKRGITTVSLPSPPVSPEPSPSADRLLRKRLPTPANLRIPPPQPGSSSTTTTGDGTRGRSSLRAESSRGSVVNGLRRMLSAVIENPEQTLRSPSRSPTPTPSSTAPDIPIAHPEHLPAVGPWSVQRRQEWLAPPKIEEMPSEDRDVLVPTLLVGSDGHTIREGSRAEAHFAARAAVEARHRQQVEQLQAQARAQVPTIMSPQLQHHQQAPGSPPLAPCRSEISYMDAGNTDGDSAFDRVLRSNMETPTIVVVRVRPEDIPRMQETAAYQGLHTSVLGAIRRSPSGSPPVRAPLLLRGATPMSSITEEDDDRPFLVIGRDQQLTQGYVEMAQRGVISGPSADQETISAPKLITVTQLISVSFFTAIFAVTIFFFFLAL